MPPLEVATQLWKLFQTRKWDEAAQLFHPDAVVIYPQTRERFVGARNFIEFNRSYPGEHDIKVLRATPAHEVVITETEVTTVTSDEKKLKFFAASFFEFHDGKIHRLTEYWAEAADAPSWRAHLVEKQL